MQHFDSGPRMSAIVVHNGFVFTAGQLDETGADVASQARTVLAKIDALLERSGSDKSLIVSANVWLSDIATFDQFNPVWEAWVAHPAPARATVESRLARPRALIEISVIAAVRA
jgi:enamine deaminase RidA (YjgF/YER057c/UK114 family)